MSVIQMLYETAFYLGAILVIFTSLVFTVLQKHTERPQNKVYIWGAISLMAQAALDAVAFVFRPLAAMSPELRPVVEIAIYFYFVLHVALPVLLHFYALLATRMYRSYRLYQHLVGLLPFLVAESFVLLNPLTHAVYSYDEAFAYHRYWGESIIYLICAVYFLAAMGLLFFRWHASNPRRKRILFYTLTVAILGLLIQLLVPDAPVELFGESILFLGLMLSIEYDEDLQDSVTGVYNRTALLLDLRSMFEQKNHFTVVAVRFRNLELVRRLLGATSQELVEELSGSLKALHPRYLIYRVTPSVFLLSLTETNPEKVKAFAESIQQKIDEDWKAAGREAALRYHVLYASVPSELRKPEDILLMCESDLPENENTRTLSGHDLDFLFTQAALAEALHRGIEEHNFEMVYQPVFSADHHRIYAAESLLRLHDPTLGDLYPSDFIPVAERYGMIRSLGEYALREVCALLNEREITRLGIRFISVNLSILQCTDPEFVSQAGRIVEEAGVAPEKICFEISETAAAVDYRLLYQTMKHLKDLGFLFSMDGYGAGYANMYEIFSMQFDLIKMDKGLLVAASESAEGKVVLENSVRMAHDMNRRVVIVGVENAEQRELLAGLPVDYVQGNYYAATKSRSELLSMDSRLQKFGVSL